MPQCHIKCGYFVLRACGNTANKLCEGCRKPACQEHGVLQDEKYLCRDCISIANEAQVKSDVNDSNWGDFLLWKSRQRFAMMPTIGSRNLQDRNSDSAPFFTDNDILSFSDSREDIDFDDPPDSDNLLNS